MYALRHLYFLVCAPRLQSPRVVDSVQACCSICAEPAVFFLVTVLFVNFVLVASLRAWTACQPPPPLLLGPYSLTLALYLRIAQSMLLTPLRVET